MTSEPPQSTRGQDAQDSGPGLGAAAWIARLHAERIIPHLQPGDGVLQYGLGPGWHLPWLNACRRIGIALNGPQDCIPLPGIEFFTSTNDLPQGIVERVVADHAIEHLLDPPEGLVELKRLLKPGGTLILFASYDFVPGVERPSETRPFYSWNVQTLGNLVINCGFDLVDARLGTFGHTARAARIGAWLRIGERGFRLAHRLLHLCQRRREIRIVARL